ncbi:MAG: hypothetical protein EA362_08525 [Saprospirales bacterium]|nr:MAG: hypothetical protein EA362_08525 [Saprospirales bacterium]
MKSFIPILFLVFCSWSFVKAGDVVFKVEVSSDTVLIGNYFQLKFTVENARGGFVPPDFYGFEVVGGPNQASSFSMINGKVTQSASYTYYLEPLQEGILFIEPASIEIGGKIMETPILEINVLPNPDGIIENPHQLRQLQREEVPAEKETPANPRRTIRL